MAINLLGLIHCYIRVVENGSIAAAARALGMSAAAVSQNLARLEAHLGVRLLSRTTRSMALTESGTHYYEKVRHIRVISTWLRRRPPRRWRRAARFAWRPRPPSGATCWRR